MYIYKNTYVDIHVYTHPDTYGYIYIYLNTHTYIFTYMYMKTRKECLPRFTKKTNTQSRHMILCIIVVFIFAHSHICEVTYLVLIHVKPKKISIVCRFNIYAEAPAVLTRC